MNNDDIEKIEVKTFLLKKKCLKCNNGYIIRDLNININYLSNPIKIPVKCDNPNCDFCETVYENEIYPKFCYEEIKK